MNANEPAITYNQVRNGPRGRGVSNPRDPPRSYKADHRLPFKRGMDKCLIYRQIPSLNLNNSYLNHFKIIKHSEGQSCPSL